MRRHAAWRTAAADAPWPAPTPLDNWDNATSPPSDPILHAHKLGYHDVPEDDCPACRVDRGAALLDERRPGWWEDVDVERLRMTSACRCVLGQTCGGYFDGLDAFNLWVQAADFGFDARTGDDAEYDTLTELWRSKISERRAR